LFAGLEGDKRATTKPCGDLDFEELKMYVDIAKLPGGT
jgi:hypothetical protein